MKRLTLLCGVLLLAGCAPQGNEAPYAWQGYQEVPGCRTQTGTWLVIVGPAEISPEQLAELPLCVDGCLSDGHFVGFLHPECAYRSKRARTLYQCEEEFRWLAPCPEEQQPP